MFGSTGSSFGGTSSFGTFGSTSTTTNSLGLGNTDNPMKDVEVQSPPDDTVSALKFSPKADFLIGSSWANDVRCWEVKENGQTVPKAQQFHTGPILDCCWHDDGTKVFTASTDKQCKMWDLNSNQAVQVAQHDKPVKTCQWIQAPNYSCLMTGSWDNTVKFWDTRQSNPMMVLQIPERVYCADVVYPMAIVGTAQRGIICYQLENQPSEVKRLESPLKYQNRCVSIFRDPKKNNQPVGFALGSVEGRVAIQFIEPQNPKDNFTFKCHRSNGTGANVQDIYAVNDIAFHPVHFCSLATVGSDGKFSFWDRDARTKLKGHEFYNPQVKPKIFLRNCAEELKPRKK
ncbi:mRNA export factor-like isoform X2 [Porites lutea]|uniref:mRNA export factor-like isoform X2 n=1 Tax=Porites lutea TaxID=51062 RepID=UPI003CC52808